MLISTFMLVRSNMAAPLNNVDLMDDEPSFGTILLNFGLSLRARNHLTEDYPTANDLMASNVDQIKSVVYNQNKTYRNHTTVNQRCYINTAQLNRVLAFYRWTVFAVKDAQASYDTASAVAFDLDWINSTVDTYNMKDPDVTEQSTSFSVTIPIFNGNNWHDVKAKLIALLNTRVGHCGIPLTYLVRDARQSWEDTENMPNLQERRIATKVHEGHTFELDNRELFRILMNTFTSTTLDNVVRAQQKHNNGIAAWSSILANVEGANYASELKRQGDQVIDGAFFDPTKNFTFEKYFDKHVKSHELHAAAMAPVPEWRKIDQFMKNIKCSLLQNDYRALKDLPQYQTFTAFYNKMNENYRTLIQQGLLKPVSIFKRKISQVETSDYGGRGRGRGGRGRSNYRGRGRGRGRGRSGRGRGGRGQQHVDLSCLPREVDVNNLNSFSDEQWFGFTNQQRQAIWALRNLQSRGGQRDDVSELGQGSISGGTDNRQVYQMSQGAAMPPPPNGNAAPRPPGDSSSQHGGSTRSSSAGQAFGR